MNFRKLAQIAKIHDEKQDFKLADIITNLLLKTAQEAPFELAEGEASNDPKTVLDYFVGYIFDMVSRKPTISKGQVKAELDKKIDEKLENLDNLDKVKLSNIKEDVMNELEKNSWYVKLPEVSEDYGKPGEITGGPKEFLEKLGPAAQQASENVGNNIPASVILAMAAWESGWGKSKLAAEHGNFFGIKQSPTSGASSGVSMNTFEFNGGKHQETAEFAKFDSDATAAMSALPNFFANNKRYTEVFRQGEIYKNNKSMSNLFSVVDAIFRAGYSTDPGEPDNIKKLITRYSLDRYD
jgi:flagellum-specific peptidoglycan hydrolase FlgJ